MPNVLPRARYPATPSRRPSSSSPRWRSEQPAMLAPAAKRASRSPAASVTTRRSATPRSYGARSRLTRRAGRPHTPGRMRHRATLPAARVALLAALLLLTAAGPAAARPARDPDAATLLLRVRAHERVRLHHRPGGRVVAVLGDRTEFGSHTVLTVLARRGSWAQVSVAVLGGKRAWLRVDGHVARRATRWQLRADISARTLEVTDDGGVRHDSRVAVGAAISPTPTGRFQVTDKLKGPKFGASYGCCIMALSTDQPPPPPGWAGMARMAVHGTNAEGTVGDAVSAGCLHAHAAAMRWLVRHVPVGAPVVIVRCRPPRASAIARAVESRRRAVVSELHQVQ